MRRFFVTLALIAVVLAPFGGSARGNDRQIAEQIVRGLKHRQDSGDLHGFNIDLQVDKGSVWLKGHVSDPEQERLALEVARRVEGVQRVFNQIEVLASEEEDDSTATSADPSSQQLVSNRRVKRANPAVAGTLSPVIMPSRAMSVYTMPASGNLAASRARSSAGVAEVSSQPSVATIPSRASSPNST